ncbi:HlyD family type I secretion periplasmic adaptor subunit [Pseudoalteromonas sp. S16_S37]|uniref:HlyD family type I secretion periplasmic adaptor subunit n=1 Tax=Pseudoalteromonas sp. S16_S37 TaxID=2720228 RepID=UPI001681553D|nr:HlyD family type I secretion periplasmic adaptor subunit [Pseudoalteromonas sp. S16_S37]MBD1583403.1 HlyD family type I secretion periplasmic adaptor subunit [Pseudoalteromonas sp. S16_S37]
MKSRVIDYEFLPAALEIQAAPPPKLARGIVWTLVSLLIVGITWICLSPIDIVATATGKVVPKQRVKTVQPMESGVISKIYTYEGQKVNKGDLLLELDPAINAAQSRNLAHQQSDLQQQIYRLTQYSNWLENKSAQSLPQLTSEQARLLNSEKRLHETQISMLSSEVARLEAELQSAQLSKVKIEKTLPLLQERTDSLEKLQSSKMVSREEYLALKQEALALEAQLPIESANVKRLRAAVASANSNLQQKQAEAIQNTLAQINQLQVQYHQISEDLVKSRFLEQKMQLRAPVSGTVENLTVTTLGEVVTPAQELMRIIPEDDELIVDAGLLNKDIGFAYAGQSVEVKVESFPFTRYGVIEGTLIDVSTDAVEHEQLGLIFPIKVKLDKQSLNVDGREVPLSAGMNVTAEVKTGQRYIVEFLLSPIIQHAHEGARER